MFATLEGEAQRYSACTDGRIVPQRQEKPYTLHNLTVF